MSTKLTIAYGFPPGADFHLYYDYKDSEYHLDFYGDNASQLTIPEDAMEAILEAFRARGFTLPGNLDYLEQQSAEAEKEIKDDLSNPN
jgi:hypothetical protein